MSKSHFLCESCDALVINGLLCHEKGCPDSWKNTARECKWCGQEFKPESSNQLFCDENCAISYNE